MDSQVYGHLWGTGEVRGLFDDRGRTRIWVEILAALAGAQAELGMIPAAAAEAVGEPGLADRVDLGLVAQRTRATGHSTLGLIQVLAELLPADAREWVYYGATVQDVTDTWTGLVMQRVTAVASRDLRRTEASLLDLAAEHRDTVMAGRTHAQPGLPVTFGYKAAVWAAEVRRHLGRWAEARDRLAVGQLAGAVGTASFWGDDALALQRRFCARLGLAAPDMTWLTARDRIAEFVGLLAMSTATIAKVGNEVVNLQRAEIGEVRETFKAGVVGSITMPHKRNPELSEHVVTLARVVRSAAGLALEGMVTEHERDGAAWKTEWAFLPEACMAAAACLALGVELVGGLDVDAERMRANLDAQHGYLASETVLRTLAPRLGKHTAQRLVYDAAMAGIEQGQPFARALTDHPDTARALADDDLAHLLDPSAAVGQAGALVDQVLATARKARPADPDGG